MPKYDNSVRLSTVSDQDWCEALDELTTYLKWRLKGRTKWGAHSEKVYGIQVPKGAWHSIEVHEPSTIFEAKDGAYGK